MPGPGRPLPRPDAPLPLVAPPQPKQAQAELLPRGEGACRACRAALRRGSLLFLALAAACVFCSLLLRASDAESVHVCVVAEHHAGIQRAIDSVTVRSRPEALSDDTGGADGCRTACASRIAWPLAATASACARAACNGSRAPLCAWNAHPNLARTQPHDAAGRVCAQVQQGGSVRWWILSNRTSQLDVALRALPRLDYQLIGLDEARAHLRSRTPALRRQPSTQPLRAMDLADLPQFEGLERLVVLGAPPPPPLQLSDPHAATLPELLPRSKHTVLLLTKAHPLRLLQAMRPPLSWTWRSCGVNGQPAAAQSSSPVATGAGYEFHCRAW